MKRPNLFNYATSELSQDAFLCWLLAWASPEYANLDSSLSKVAKNLIQTIFKESNQTCPAIFDSVDVRRQVDHIDVLCIINENIAILIEDKRGTVEHGNQIARYKQILQSKRGFTPEQIIPVYVQTGDQDFSAIKRKGYVVLRRQDLLEVLADEAGSLAQKENNIFQDFVANLRDKENAVAAYATTPIGEWNWACWVGFYQALQDAGISAEWSYVANPAGGFYGFWWHFRNGSEGEQVYLQWEQKDLCFKIAVGDKSKRGYLRGAWYTKIMDEAKRQGLTVMRPNRFGSGSYMTVVTMNHALIADAKGVLDFQATLKVMKAAEKIIDSLT